MKTLMITFLIGLSALGCRAQEKLLLGNAASLRLTTGAQKVTAAQAKLHVMRKLSGNKSILDELTSFSSDQFYVIGNALVNLHTGNEPAEANHLAILKNGIDHLFKNDTSYHSFIQTDDHKSVLSRSYIYNGIQYYRFISFNTQNTKSVSGSVECNVADAAEGKKVYDMIISSLKFE
ncbi:hypothetical protein GCM10027037_32120 [Mucilaginibacter koreensis]